MLTVLSLLVYFVALTNGADKKKCADHLTANTGGLSPTHSSDHYLAEDTGKGYPPGASIHYSVTVSGSDCTGLTCVLACHYKRNSGGDDVEYNWSKIKCSTGGSGWKSAGSYFAEGSVPSSAKTKAKDLLKAKGDISAHFADYGELFEDDEYEGIECYYPQIRMEEVILVFVYTNINK